MSSFHDSLQMSTRQKGRANASAAEVYGPLRAQLEGEGRRLDEPDLRIASIALSRELTLVTGRVRHFSRVPGLEVENWLAP